MSSMCYVCVCIVLIMGLCQDSSTQPLLDQPIKDVYVAVGSEVKVLCEGAASGEPVEWTLNGSPVLSGSLLHLNSISLGKQGIYTCRSLRTGTVIQQIHLKPGNLPLPPDIKCWAPSYPLKALCSLTQTTETYLPTWHIITYRNMDSGTVYPCHIIPKSPDFLCEMNNLQVLATRPYIINVTAINALGSASKSIVFDLEAHVKPDPPGNVRVVAGQGRRVWVEWNPPASWPDFDIFPLKYKVRYYWGNSQEPGHIIEVESHDSLTICLESLKVGRTYHFQVSARDLLDHGKGSEWSQPVSATVR